MAQQNQATVLGRQELLQQDYSHQNSITGQYVPQKPFYGQISGNTQNQAILTSNQQEQQQQYEHGVISEKQRKQIQQINGQMAMGQPVEGYVVGIGGEQNQEKRRNSAPQDEQNDRNQQKAIPSGASGPSNKQFLGICSDPSSSLFILEHFVEPIYEDFVYLTEKILNKSMKSANKQLQDTLMNYFLENHVSNLIIKDMNCISKRAVRCEIEKTMLKNKTAKYMNLLNAFEGKVKLFSKEKNYENLLMQLITDENSGPRNSEQWKTLVRKRILALLLYVHWQTVNADQIFNDFFAIWDRIYPNHPLPQKVKKSLANGNYSDSLSRTNSTQQNPISNSSSLANISPNKQMKRSKQKIIEQMNISQSSLSSQISYGDINNTNSNYTSFNSTAYQQYQPMPSQQSQNLGGISDIMTANPLVKMSDRNNNGQMQFNQQNYSQQQFAGQFQPRFMPQVVGQSQQQFQLPNQALDDTGLISLQGSSSAYYPSQLNGFSQQGQSQQQWVQSRQQYELPQEDLNNHYQTQTPSEQVRYNQSTQYLQIPTPQPIPNARPAKQVLKGRMRSQSWDDQGYKREEDKYQDNQAQSLANNNNSSNNNPVSSQSLASNLMQISNSGSQGQFSSQQKQPSMQQFYSQNVYDIPLIEPSHGYFEPQYMQTQSGYYVDYTNSGSQQQMRQLSNPIQLQELQQQYQLQQQQQQRQSSVNTYSYIGQNSYFQAQQTPQQQQTPSSQVYQNNTFYSPTQQQQQELQQQQYSPSVQKIPFFSSQMYDIQEVKQEGTPSSESGNNSSKNKQFYQLDKIVLADPDTPQEKMGRTPQGVSATPVQYQAGMNHTQIQQQQQQYPLQYCVPQQQQQQSQAKQINLNYYAPQLQQHQQTIPLKNTGMVQSNAYQQMQHQQPAPQLRVNQLNQEIPKQTVSSSQAQGNNNSGNTVQERYEGNYYNDMKATKQEEDSYQGPNIYDTQQIAQQQNNQRGQNGSQVTSKKDQQKFFQEKFSQQEAGRNNSLAAQPQQQQLMHPKLEDLESTTKAKTNNNDQDDNSAQSTQNPKILSENRTNQQTGDQIGNSNQVLADQNQISTSNKSENRQSPQKNQQQDGNNPLPQTKNQISMTPVGMLPKVQIPNGVLDGPSLPQQKNLGHDQIREISKDIDHSSNVNFYFCNQNLQENKDENQTELQDNLHRNLNNNNEENQQQSTSNPLPYDKTNEILHPQLYQEYQHPINEGDMGSQNISDSNAAMMGSSMGVGSDGEKFIRNNQRQNTGASYMSIESEKMSFKRSDTRNMTGMSNFSIESDKEIRTTQGMNRSKFFFNRQNSQDYPPMIGMRSSFRNGTGVSNTSESNGNEFGGPILQPQFYPKRSTFKQFSGISHVSLEGELGCLQMITSQNQNQGFNVINRSQLRKRANLSVDSLSNYNVKAEKDIQNLSVDLENLNINQLENRQLGLQQDQINEHQNILDDPKLSSNNANGTNSNSSRNNQNNNLFFSYSPRNNLLE